MWREPTCVKRDSMCGEREAACVEREKHVERETCGERTCVEKERKGMCGENMCGEREGECVRIESKCNGVDVVTTRLSITLAEAGDINLGLLVCLSETPWFPCAGLNYTVAITQTVFKE